MLPTLFMATIAQGISYSRESSGSENNVFNVVFIYYLIYIINRYFKRSTFYLPRSIKHAVVIKSRKDIINFRNEVFTNIIARKTLKLWEQRLLVFSTS